MSARETDRQSLWSPRDESVKDAVVQYSRFVSVMKLVLPAAAGFLLLLVIALPLLRKEEDRYHISGSVGRDADNGSLSMTNARFYGTDQQGQPYTLTAQSLQQKPNDDKIVDMHLPKAEITLKNGTWLSASANTGVFDRDHQALDLAGEVSLFQHQGNELHTNSAHVRLKEGTASGTEPISGNGPLGAIQAAGGFSFSNDDKILHFRGPTHLTIKPKTKTEEGADAAPGNAKP